MRLFFVRWTRIWISPIGLVAVAVFCVLLVIVSVNGYKDPHPLGNVMMGAIFYALADVAVSSSYKVATGGPRRAAIKAGFAAWDEGDPAKAVEILAPFERELDTMVWIKYKVAINELKRSST